MLSNFEHFKKKSLKSNVNFQNGSPVLQTFIQYYNIKLSESLQLLIQSLKDLKTFLHILLCQLFVNLLLGNVYYYLCVRIVNQISLHIRILIYESIYQNLVDIFDLCSSYLICLIASLFIVTLSGQILIFSFHSSRKQSK